MTRLAVLTGIVVVLAALIVTACGPAQQQALQTMVAMPQAPADSGMAVAVAPTETPAMSIIELPTLAPTVGGPLGTMTAIAHMFATSEQDAEPYVIEVRGKPHFIEFHAWW